MGKLFVGTSGWVYKGWAGAFYPQGLPSRKHLEFYTTCRKCLRRGLDVYAYFNNDLNSRAPENARQFIGMIRGKPKNLQAPEHRASPLHV